MDRFERKRIVDRFNALVEKLDDNLTEVEDELVRSELDDLWYKDLDPIAEIQVDPLRVGLRVGLRSDTEIEIVDKKATDEGNQVRLTGQIHHLELDDWDALDAVVPWSRLDLCFPSMYDNLAKFWNIERPQDMEFHDAYWVPKDVMES